MSDDPMVAALAAGFGMEPANLAVEQELAFNRGVSDELHRLRVRTEARRQFDAGESADPAMFDDQYLDADQLGNLPTPKPMIDGVLDRHCYAILRGRDGTYKTFVALDWALCLATGKPWQGRAVQRVRVLYIAGEGAYGIAGRKDAWEYGWRAQVEPEWFTLRQSAVNLYKGGPALDDLINRTSEGRYGLVVVDTLRRASGGADGNGTDMGVVVDNIERVKRATLDGSVLALTHTDKGDNDSRGFSGIEDDADIVWHAKRDQDRGALALNLENVKMKDAPEGLTFDLVMAAALSSLVVSKAADRITVDEMHDTDRQILATMHDLFALTGATVTQLVEVTELPRSTVYKSRGRLLSSGRLLVTRRGSSDLLTIPRHAVESGVESGVDSTPDSTPVSNDVHTTAEHDSTPVHTDSTPDSTPVHTAPPVYKTGVCVDTVDETPSRACASDECECGNRISDLRQWNGKSTCIDCEVTS